MASLRISTHCIECPFQIVILSEPMAAVETLKGFLVGVNKHVSFQFTSRVEGFGAVRANERFFPRVSPRVYSKVPAGDKALPTQLARIRPFPSVVSTVL